MKKKLLVISGIVVLLAAAAVPAYYFYIKYQTLYEQVQNEGKDDVQALIAKVGRLILLPASEIPTIVTVTDKQKLSGQDFFANAKNGDKVLVYEQAKKAFLYDPDANKVLEVGPVTNTESTPSGDVAGQTAPVLTATPTPVRFALANGTVQEGLTSAFEAKLRAIVPNAKIITRTNTELSGYSTTFLVDVMGTKTVQAQEIARAIGIQVGVLPEGEAIPAGADYLIIIGIDQQ